MLQIVHQFHLAFKGKDAGEIYGELMEQLLRAVRKYDPGYEQKVKSIVEIIDEKYADRKQFTLADLNRYLEFDATSHCRMLVRRGHLAGSRGEFQRGAWPPPAELLEGEPIGLTHCVQMWFKYYLQQWITDSMSQLETKEGVYSLDYRGGGSGDPALDHAPVVSDLAIPAASSGLTHRRAMGQRGPRVKKIAFRRRAEASKVVGGSLRYGVKLSQQVLDIIKLNAQTAAFQLYTRWEHRDDGIARWLVHRDHDTGTGT